MSALTTGEALVAALEARGIRHVFGIPGVHTIELYRGLSESGLTHVLPKHEQGAGFMADGYARVTGNPAALFLITGPGLTNALTAMGQAYSDSVPMLVIASGMNRGDQGRQYGRLHESRDQRAMAESVTAFAARCETPEDVPDFLDRAFAVFQGQRPRPVYIEIPMDVLAAPAPDNWTTRHHAPMPGPRKSDIDHAAELLAKAERPMMIVGGGARAASEDVRALAEHLSMPVFSTIAGKGILPPDHPLWLDAVLHRTDGRALLAEADVVLTVGSELAESEFLTPDPLPIRGEMIRIDVDAQVLCDDQPTSLPILSDAVEAMAQLLACVTLRVKPRNLHHDALSRFRTSVRASEQGLDRVYLDTLGALADTLPAATRIFTDMTTLAYAGNYLYPTPTQGRWFHPAGFGALGHALPAAMGAAIADPETPVVAVIGDGGFQFTLPELAVMAELDLPVTVILWNNTCFGQIHKGMVRRAVTPVATTYASPDFIALTEAYGIVAHRPFDRTDAMTMLADALASRRPALIELSPEMFGATGPTPDLLSQ